MNWIPTARVLRRIVVIVVAGLCLPVIACSSDSSDPAAGTPVEPSTTDAPTTTAGSGTGGEPADLVERLEAAESRWDDAGITSYRFEVRQICFCAPPAIEPLTVTVRNGEVEEVIDSFGEPVEPDDFTHLTTVPALFDLVHDHVGAYFVEVAFDEESGHPTMIDTDPDRNIADDELAVIVETLTPIE